MCLEPIFDDPYEQKHDQEELSSCCRAPLQMHWPCDQRARCSNCKECAICGGNNFEAEAIQEAERKRG